MYSTNKDSNKPIPIENGKYIILLNLDIFANSNNMINNILYCLQCIHFANKYKS